MEEEGEARGIEREKGDNLEKEKKRAFLRIYRKEGQVVSAHWALGGKIIDRKDSEMLEVSWVIHEWERNSWK